MSAASPSAVLNSEWTKIRTVRSTIWTLALTFILTVGISLALCAVIRTQPEVKEATFDPTSVSFSGMTFGQIIMVVFGVLVVSSEYTTGMIRASLSAVPQRGVFFASKVTIGGVLALVVSMITAFVTFFFAQLILDPYNVSISDSGVLRAVFGAGLYMTLICLFSMGLAGVLRSSVLSLGILIPLFFIVSPILTAIPKVKTAAQYLPDQAGVQVTQVMSTSGDLGPWSGLLVLVGWAAAALLAGYLLLRSRDA